MAATYQPKVGAPREIVVGIAELEQSLRTVWMTPLNSVPGRIGFGTDHSRFLDVPVNVMRPAAMRELRRAVRASEPRITLLDVVTTPVDPPGHVCALARWKPTKPIDPTRPDSVVETEIII